MKDASNDDTMHSDGSSAAPDEKAEQVILTAQRIVTAEESRADETELREVTDSLISLYDSGFNESGQRYRAVRLVGALAKRHDLVLDRVIENAHRYSRTQHIDDAFPYEPNGFDVLAEMGQGRSKVISFLRDTVRNDWGIPRWKAIEVLCKLDDPEANSIVVEVIQGKYPSRNPDVLNDLRPIEQVKGRDYVQRHELSAHKA